MQLSFHSVAVVLTLVQTKQIRINIHKRKSTKTQHKKYKTQQILIHILPKQPHNCQNTHILQIPHIHTPTHYKSHTYTHPHITKQVKTTTVQDTHQMK
jgi:hypothetical protein